jgi:MFS family permease
MVRWGVVFGPLADFVGRRGAVFVSLVFYVVGALGLVLGTVTSGSSPSWPCCYWRLVVITT